MKLGDRFFLSGAFDRESLAFIRQLGADGAMVNISGCLAGNQQGSPAIPPALERKLQSGPYWEANDLLELRQAVESFGLELFAIAHVPPHRYQKALLGLPGRDEEIENWCRSLKAMGQAGIPILGYGWGLNAGAKYTNWRTAVDVPIRGGALGEGFDHTLVKDTPITELGVVTDEQLWDTLTYFLKAVIPVAEEAGVRMAMHPSDPQVPSLAGIARIMRSPEAFDRLLDTVPSHVNGINFCQGCFSQMLDEEGVYQAIRHFASRKAIALVHFRNVVGTKEAFTETFWDDGKVNMAKAIKVYRELGYDGYLTPDHHPHMVGDTAWGHRARAFALGYIRGLLQASGS